MMRRLLVLSTAVCSLAVCVLHGCTTNDPDPLYLDINYQVRCIDCDPRANDQPPRDIHYLDGDSGYDVSCEVDEGGDLVTFGASWEDPDGKVKPFSLEVSQASASGGQNGGACSVSVVEGANHYQGACSDGEPTAKKPCKLDLQRANGVITGTLYCDNIPIKGMAGPMFTRYVTTPDTKKPAKLELHGCPF